MSSNNIFSRRRFGVWVGAGLAAALTTGAAQERRVAPTFLRRHIPALPVRTSEYTTPECAYKPVFGVGDPDAEIARSLARYGELTIQSGGACASVRFPQEELVYVILAGEGGMQYGATPAMIRANDFFYVPPGLTHSLRADAREAVRAIVMGFRIPQGETAAPPPRLMLANIDDVPKQVVGNHPPTTLYQLLMGPRDSRRDKLAVAHVLTSLFLMEFAPGGTNFPHHHEEEEEVYLLLEGYGDMVAGGGMDGVQGLHPSKAGDAYFFRLNCTVGFYSRGKPGEPPARILAARSRFPFQRRQP